STGVDSTAKIRRPQPRSNTKNDRVPSASKSSCSKNKEVDVEEHPRNLMLSKNKTHMSSDYNNVKLAIQNDQSEVVCAMCYSNHMTWNLKLLINFVWKFLGTVRFGNDHVAAILGFGDLQWGNILIASSGLDLTYAPSTITAQQPTEGELDLLFEAMYDDYIGGQPSATPRTALAAQAPQKTCSVCDPKGFIDADHPSHVYKSNKALYGLKQAPRAWYDKLSTFLLQNHFFKGTIDPTLFIRRFDDDNLVDSGFKLTGFSDADYARCKDTFQSTFDGAQFLGIWVRTQLMNYGFHCNKVPIYYDSKLSIAISCKPVQHTRIKHIAVRYHFIKEHVENGTIELYFVKMDYQLADLVTKALPVDRFNYLVHRLGELYGNSGNSQCVSNDFSDTLIDIYQMPKPEGSTQERSIRQSRSPREQSHDEVYGCLKGGSRNSKGNRLAISMVEEAWLSEKEEV
nr:hypothetical protein [Tanacetum cinerariifolium]